MADSETQQVDVKKLVTEAMAMATKQKNPKRVAAGKAIAERIRQAREAYKKALAEVNVIIANNQLKQPEPPAVAPEAPPAEPSKNVLTTTQQSSRDSDGYPLAGQDEVDNAKQSSAISE